MSATIRLPSRPCSRGHPRPNQATFRASRDQASVAGNGILRRAKNSAARAAHEHHSPGMQCAAAHQRAARSDNPGRANPTPARGLLPASHPLSSLAPGAAGKVTEIKVAPANRPRLMEMGLLVGTPVELVRFAPLGDPVEIKVRGYHLTLRKHEA